MRIASMEGDAGMVAGKSFGLSGLAAVFSIGFEEARQLAGSPEFPRPRSNQGWACEDVWRWAGRSYDRRFTSRVPLSFQPAAHDPVPYRAAIRGGSGLVYMVWDTSAGPLLVAYGTGPWSNAGNLPALDEMPVPDAYAVVSVTDGIYPPLDPDLPELLVAYPGIPRKLDLDLGIRTSWPVLSAFLGQKIPFFPPLMRSAERIESWRPDSAPIVDLPLVPDHEVAPLFVVAGMEQNRDGPVARTLLDLALARQGGAVHNTLEDLAEVERAQDADYCITIAARPAILTDRAYNDRRVSDIDRRAAWMELFHRDDELAAACLRIADVLDGSRCFPYTHWHAFDGRRLERLSDDLPHSVVHEWLDTLVPSKRTAGHARLEQRGQHDHAEYLEDPATGAPVVELRRDWGGRVKRHIVTLIPERIVNTSPLAEVILEDLPWVRTADGALYLMPVPQGTTSLTWGYSGHGPGALAATVEALLDDVTALGTREEHGTSVTNLMEREFPHGTVFDRAALVAAREQPHTWNM